MPDNDLQPYTYQIRNIDPELWIKVKVYAASHGVSMRQLILELLEAKVGNGRKG